MVDAAAPAPPIGRVRIERRGGLAGLRPSVELDGASLNAAERDAVHDLLAAGTAPRPASPGADRYTYRLTVVDPQGGDRSVDVPEDAMPPALARRVRPAPA